MFAMPITAFASRTMAKGGNSSRIRALPEARLEGRSAVFFATGRQIALSNVLAVWSIGSSTMPRTGFEEAFHCVEGRDDGQKLGFIYTSNLIKQMKFLQIFNLCSMSMMLQVVKFVPPHLPLEEEP
jgi:hypothetical protein